MRPPPHAEAGEPCPRLGGPARPRRAGTSGRPLRHRPGAAGWQARRRRRRGRPLGRRGDARPLTVPRPAGAGHAFGAPGDLPHRGSAGCPPAGGRPRRAGDHLAGSACRSSLSPSPPSACSPKATVRTRRALHLRTGGNAFFVTECLGGQGEVPETLRGAVLARAGRLAPSGRTALDVASVSPGSIELWLLDALGAPLEGVDECVTRGLLVSEGDSVRFRHELARQAVHDAVPPGGAAGSTTGPPGPWSTSPAMSTTPGWSTTPSRPDPTSSPSITRRWPPPPPQRQGHAGRRSHSSRSPSPGLGGSP